MLIICNKDWGPYQVTIKYFKSGHSFMKVDFVYGGFDDMFDVISKVESSNKVILFNATDFQLFTNSCTYFSFN